MIGRLGAGACTMASHRPQANFGAHVAHHAEAGRDVLQLFGHVLAQVLQSAPPHCGQSLPQCVFAGRCSVRLRGR